MTFITLERMVTSSRLCFDASFHTTCVNNDDNNMEEDDNDEKKVGRVPFPG